MHTYIYIYTHTHMYTYNLHMQSYYLKYLPRFVADFYVPIMLCVCVCFHRTVEYVCLTS